eukprot:scaffold2015_cov186-Amphora_coffeaeformis.AAC.11
MALLSNQEWEKMLVGRERIVSFRLPHTEVIDHMCQQPANKSLNPTKALGGTTFFSTPNYDY